MSHNSQPKHNGKPVFNPHNNLKNSYLQPFKSETKTQNQNPTRQSKRNFHQRADPDYPLLNTRLCRCEWFLPVIKGGIVG
jgi:hypothetical protein